MTEEIETNVAERRRWNDAYWASVWPKREQLTSAVSDILLGHLGLAKSERVLDVGSGGGATTIAAGGLVGEGGSVVGADISAPLVDLARRRAVDQQAANVSFCVADVQHDTVPGGPFDVDDGQLTFLEVREELFEQARRGVDEHLARLGGSDGHIEARLAFQIFTASC